MAGLGFLDERVELAGLGVSGDPLIPKFLAVFLQPVGNGVNLFRVKPGDRRFDFFYRARNGLTLPLLNREVKTGLVAGLVAVSLLSSPRGLS